MSDRVDAISTVRSAFVLLQTYARRTGRPFPRVASEYAVLLRPPPTDVESKIRWLEGLSSLHEELATCYGGSSVFESRGNQRKLLILTYFSGRDCAASFDVSSDLKMSLINASERLRRYYKQGLLTRKAVERRRRGRRTMVYEFTEAGRRRLAFLERTVKFRRAETNESERYRSRQLMVEKMAKALRQRLPSP